MRGLVGTASPARARKAIRELVPLSDGGEALELAVRFARTADYSSDMLLRLWPLAADPDGFCAALLAPAFTREGRTELRLRRTTSLRGLRHLTMLRSLHLDRCKEITDLTEVGALGGLTDLDLDGCAGVEDLTPVGRLTGLTRLDLHRCRAVADTAPLLTLSRLRELDLSMTKVRSTHGFGSAFPALESLTLRGCRAFKDAGQLSGLKRLTSLDLGWTGIRDLTGLRDVPAVTRLDLRSCGQLRNLVGIDVLAGLTELELDDCPRLKSVDGLGSHPRLTQVGIHGCPELADLSGLSALTNLTRLHIRGSEQLTSLSDIASLRLLESVGVLDCPSLRDFSALGALPSLRRLLMSGLDELRDLSPLGVVGHGRLADVRVNRCRNLRTFGDLGGLTALSELWINDCPSLTDLDHLGTLPALSKLTVLDCPLLTDINGLAGSPIREVGFYRVPNLTSLRVLEECPDLRKLEAAGCALGEGIPVGSIDTLSLREVDWTDVSRLAGHKNLRVLDIRGLAELEDIGALTGLSELTDIRLDSCHSLEDCRPLLDLPSLRHVTMPYQMWYREYEGHPDPVMTELAERGVTVAHP
ncbi:leucine-rich repeat domain-containing protein [Streptomyces avermitilis]|uniref:leucine-rich repeat domain-containing protein n=1 Tax=Streptomyces avermitilis TaxID=33903 RepID=UPI0033E18CE0